MVYIIKSLSSIYSAIHQFLLVLIFLGLFTILVSVSVAEDVTPSKIFVLEGDSVFLTSPNNSPLYSGNPRVVSIDGNQAVAGEAGTSIIYYKENGHYNKLTEIVVLGNKLEILFIYHGSTKDSYFHTVPYVNVTSLSTTDNKTVPVISNNSFSSYDVVIFQTSPDSANFWSEPLESAFWDGNESGTLMLALSGIVSESLKEDSIYVPYYADFRVMSDYLIQTDHTNRSFADNVQNAYNIVVMSGTTIPPDPVKIQRGENLSPILAKHALWKMVLKAETSCPSAPSLEYAKNVLNDLTSGPEDYILATHELKKDLSDNIVVSKVIIDHPDLYLKLGSQKELKASVLTSMGIASDTKVEWKSENESVAIVDGFGSVTAVGEGSTQILAEIEGKPPAVSNVTVKKYVSVFLADNSSILSDSALLSAYPTRGLYDFTAKRNLSAYDNFSKYDIIFATINSNYFNSVYAQGYDEGSVVINLTKRIKKENLKNYLENMPYTHVAVGSNNSTSAIAGVYYGAESADTPIQSPFAEYLHDFNKNPSHLEDFVLYGEVEKEALKVFVDKFKNLANAGNSDSEYTEESWGSFSSKYNQAEELLSNPDATPEEFGIYVYDLKEAYRALNYTSPGTVTSVVIPESFSLPVDSIQKIEVTVSGDDLKVKDVTWISDNPAVVSVNDIGVVKALSAGTANITATSILDDSKSSICKVDVFVKAQSIYLSSSKETLTMGDSPVHLTATVHPLSASFIDLVWTSDNIAVASVSDDGLVTPEGPGKTTIRATATVSENVFNSATGNIDVIETKISSECELIVKAGLDDRIRILFVGDALLPGVQAAADGMFYCGYFDYEFVNGYDLKTLKVNPKLIELSETFDEYDIIYFDMFGDYDLISDSLVKAKNAGTKLVSLESNAHPPEYFVSFSASEDQKKSKLYNYYSQLLVKREVSTASFLWGEKFLLQSARDYAPATKIGILSEDRPLNILYIGKEASNFSDTVTKFSKGVYGDAAVWTVLPYNETSKEYEEFFNFTDANNGVSSDRDISQIEAINNHLKNQLEENKYDLIICDGIEGTTLYNTSPPTLYSHFSHMYAVEEAANDDAHPAHIVLIGRVGIWLPLNLNFSTDSSNLSLQLTFGLTDDNLKESNIFLFELLQKYGNERVKSWEFTEDSGSLGGASYFHPVPGSSRMMFSDIDDYIAWATKNSYFDPEKPSIGIWMFASDVGSGTDALIFALENENVNVIAATESFDDIPHYYTWNHTNPDGTVETRQIDAAISIKNFGLNYWNYPEGIRQLEQMDVPVLKGFFAAISKENMTNISDKNNMVDGLNGARMTLTPNRDGIFDFIVLGVGSGVPPTGSTSQIDWMAERAAAWAYLKHKENSQKDIAVLYYNYPPGKADIGANYLNVMRSLAGCETASFDGILKTMNGTGQYTDVHGRELGGYTVDITRLPVATRLNGTGRYTFDYFKDAGQTEEQWEKRVMNEDNLMNLMLSQGINVGSHAPGVLDGVVSGYISYLDAGGAPEDWWGCQLLPMSAYKKWYDETEISDDLRDEITSVWGKPWEDAPSEKQSGMIWQDKEGRFGAADELYFVFPAVRMGRVWILPQPDRALTGDIALEGDLTGLSSKDYHGDIPPTHQYVAFYFWLNRGMTDGMVYGGRSENNKELYGSAWTYEWKPDAIVHFGTHGTHEWLPGTAIGMQQGTDWGPILIGRLPNIYPYIVANVGEGLTAEYRGDALIIDHLTPAMIRSGLYGDLLDLDSEIQSFIKQFSMGNLNTQLSYEYKVRIADKIFRSGVSEALDLSAYEKNISGTVTDEKLKAELLKASDQEFSDLMKNQVHNYLDDVMENALPYGMHVYGQSPDDIRTAYMVRAMWGNYRFEELIREVYFKDLPAGLSIPFEPVSDGSGGYYYNGKCDADVQNFTTKYVRGVSIQQALTETLGTAPPADMERIELFIRGPVMFYEDNADKPDDDLKALLLENWNRTGVKEVIIDEMCTDFVPASVSSGGALNQTKFDQQYVRFVEDFIANMKTYSAAESVDRSLTRHFNINGYTSQTWINQGVIDEITACRRDSFSSDLKSCGSAEMDALMSALSAGYIPPTTGNDPIQNPSILPTGRNFYGINPDTYPTRAAWEVGQSMGEQILVDYYENHGTFPKMVSFTRFGVEFIRDEGALEACIYYMLGCEPTWSGNQYTGTGTFTGGRVVTDPDHAMFTVTLSNGTQVQRPRVDIVYNTAGMRDGFPMAIRYIDRAVRAVNDLPDDPLIENNIKKNTASIEEALREANIGLTDEQIKELAVSRTFAQELGTYEIGTGNLISSGGSMTGDPDTDRRNVADLYLRKMGFVYNDNSWGGYDSEAMNKAMSETLKQLLIRSDASVFASSSNLYDSLDNDDVFQYFGVMNTVSEVYGGRLPDMYWADTRNVNNFKPGDKVVTTMQAALKRDLDSRYLNPEWIKGMQESGYSGASMMAEFLDNVYGWSVATNGALVSDDLWRRISETYVDGNVMDGDRFVYAYQSMTGRLIDAVRTGYWNASEAEVQNLTASYVQSVLDAGVACCHHTCGNPSFDAFVAGIMSSPLSDIDEETQNSYWEALKTATGREKPFVPGPSSDPSEIGSSGGGVGKAVVISGTAPLSGDVVNDGQDGQNPPDAGDRTDASGRTDDRDSAGDGAGADMTKVSGYELVQKTVSGAVSSVTDFLRNPTFSASNVIVILLIVVAVGIVFYGTRRRGV